MANILLLNGPNLNLLGTREPDVYGSTTLPDIEQALIKSAEDKGHLLSCLQSNAEHELIDAIHAANRQEILYIIFNPGAFTHTSIALRDALLGVAIPFFEVHLSNVYKREAFRHKSYFSDIAEGALIGFGANGYQLALQHVYELLETK